MPHEFRDRRRWWSTRRSDNPGVHRVSRNCWQARISIDGRWVHLGCFDSEWKANRVVREARERKRRGLPLREIRQVGGSH